MSVAMGIPISAWVGVPWLSKMAERRQDHAAQGGKARQRGLLPTGQLADVELALDLQANEQEEHRHQAIVDPMFELYRLCGW